MSDKRVYRFLCVCLAFGLLSACTMPASKGPTVKPSVAITQAVQTMTAKLTVTPKPTTKPAATSTPVQTSTQPAEATNTTVPPTVTTIPEATSTPAASPVVTLNPANPAAGLSNPDWHETFDGTGTWYAFQDDFVRFQAINNKLEMTVIQAGNRNGWALVPQLLTTKYYVEMIATFGNACKGADRFGLMLSSVSSADKGYLYGVSCEGKYVLWKWDGTRMTTLVNWKTSDQIVSGAGKTNRIGLWVDGNKLSLYANDALLTELTDVSYEKLYFGVFVGAPETAGFTVRVSNLNYWSLP